MTLRIRADQVPPELPFQEIKDGVFETSLRSEAEIPGIVRRIVEAGGNIYRVEAEQPSLEEIYFALTSSGREKSL